MINWTIHLINGDIVQGNNCNWRELANFPITTIHLHLPDKKTIFFEGYEKYLIVQTKYEFVQKKKGDILDTVNILGKRGFEVCQISYHRKGKIFQCKNEWGKEWRELVLQPLPKQKNKKMYQLVAKSAIPTNHEDWHAGIWMEKSKIYVRS